MFVSSLLIVGRLLIFHIHFYCYYLIRILISLVVCFCLFSEGYLGMRLDVGCILVLYGILVIVVGNFCP